MQVLITNSMSNFRPFPLKQVFEECRNLCLGLAARGIDWRAQGLRGGVAVCGGMLSRLFGNLMARSDSIAVAMTARGFRGPHLHELYFDEEAAAAAAVGTTDGAAAAGTRVAAGELPQLLQRRRLRLLPSFADVGIIACLALLAAASVAVV